MPTYASTFITGTNSIVEDAFKRRFSKTVRIISSFDGLILYETEATIPEITNIRFFNNTFLVLKFFKNTGTDPIHQILKDVIKDPAVWARLPSAFLKSRDSFKTVASLENEMISVNNILLKKLETKISGITHLPTHTPAADTDFWLFARREKIGFFGLRLTYPNREDGRPKKGELRHELAHILCLASDPNKDDVFLDPFAGSGAIPLERSKYFPYEKIIANDNDTLLTRELSRSDRKNFEIRHDDALRLHIAAESVGKIVTDPPWGIYKKTNLTQQEFYARMLEEFYRILKKNGLAVLLIGDKAAFADAIRAFPKFNLMSTTDILVSGKKAAIYKLTKPE
jgi:16S rRNA G966 N2-methylase RsmD